MYKMMVNGFVMHGMDEGMDVGWIMIGCLSFACG